MEYDREVLTAALSIVRETGSAGSISVLQADQRGNNVSGETKYSGIAGERARTGFWNSRSNA